jgi:hypothetical protein
MPKEPAVFNRLETSSGAGGTVPSVLGASMGDVGGVDFTQDGKFGKCATRNFTTSGGKYLTQTWTYTPAGTIEMYWIPNFDQTYTTTTYLFDFRTEGLNMACNNSSTIGLIFYPPNSTNTALVQLAYAYPESFSAGTKIHTAFVWDSSGIPGQGSRTAAFYWNGVRVAQTGGGGSDTGAIYGSNVSVTSGKVMTNNGGTAGPNSGIDNWKQYDYAKTDFSDRRDERGGMNDDSFII